MQSSSIPRNLAWGFPYREVILLVADLFKIGDQVRIIGPVVSSNFYDNNSEECRSLEWVGTISDGHNWDRSGRWWVMLDDDGERYALVDEGSLEVVIDEK